MFTQPILGVLEILTLAAAYQWQGIVLVGAAGIPWAVTQWVPFAIIGFEVSRLTREGEGNKAGAILGVHNMAISLPQVFAGLIASGVIYERYGYKKTMLGALIMIECSIFGLFFATNLRTLLVGEILCGLSWGVFQTQTTTYAAEVTPVCLRSYLTSYVNLCWVMGQFIGAGVVRGMVHKDLSQWVSLFGTILKLIEIEAYHTEMTGI